VTYAAGTAKYTEGAEKTFVCNMKYGGQPMMVTTGARKLQMVQKAHTYAFLSLLVSLLFFFSYKVANTDACVSFGAFMLL